MDVVKYLREVAKKCHLSCGAADELSSLRAENEILRCALERADSAMASAPIWHGQHRVVSEILIALKRELADMARSAPAAKPVARAEQPEAVSASA